MNNDIKYLDNQYIRSFSSSLFNFILDKETNVSVYWGQNQNDDPLYDPIGPQELTFKIQKNTSELDIIKKFNLLANIQEQKEKNKLYISILDKNLTDIYNNINLKAISTINTVIFDTASNIDFSFFIPIVKYIKKFNINTIIQIKEPIYDGNIQALKFITPNINLYFNENTIETYKTLTKEKFKVDVKIHINADNYNFIIQNLKTLKKDVKGKLFIDQPFVTKLQLSELENRIKNLKLVGIYLAACNLFKFNESQDKPFKHIIEIVNCDSCTYSLYVNNNEIYPCQNISNHKLITIKNQKHVDDIWDKSKEIKKFRQQIIDKTYCE